MEQITLQPQELRIGNWVMSVYMPYGHEQGSNYEKVTANTIHSLGNELYTSFKHYGIPLTPDILEKCGFEWETSEKKHLCHNGDGDISFSFTAEQIKEGMIYCYCDNYFKAAWEVKVKYLHQLQNLYFALCGKELEITL